MFNFLDTIANFVEKMLGNNLTFIILLPILLFIKFAIIIVLIKRSFQTTKKTLPTQLLFLIITIAGLIASDLAWFMKTLQSLIDLNYGIVLFFIRLSWGLMALQYQGLSLFLESLTENTPRLNLRQKFFSFISCAFFSIMLGIALIYINNNSSFKRPSLEFSIMKAESLYLYYIFMPLMLVWTFRKINKKTLPRILKKQITTLLKFLIIPWYLCELLEILPFEFFSPAFVASSKAMAILSSIVVTIAIYFSIRRILGFRFLNLKKQVQALQPTYTYTFIDSFKDVLEQLSFATTVTELGHITQAYFKNCFNIPLRRTNIYARKYAAHDVEQSTSKLLQHDEPLTEHETKVQERIEDFLSTADTDMMWYIQEAKIIVHDEIAFNSFYEDNQQEQKLIKLLEEIHADILLPIFDKQKIIAYIVIDRHARGSDQFYSNIEHDEMLVFANYIANVIHLLQNRNLEHIIQQEKELKEELFNKHQEINQYKESIRSFLRNNAQKKFGILFYKNRKFTFANQSAQELIEINPNLHPGHPLSLALKTITRRVTEYKATQTMIVHDNDGNKLVLTGVPNIENNTIIITAHHPELSDILATQLHQLKDPSKWDYLLYLETTSSGQLVNQLVPSNSETFLNFKIELLKTALSNKAILLDMPEADILPTVEIIHHIGLKEQLYTLNITSPEKNNDIATKLFGINHLFKQDIQDDEEPLFRRLHNTGTLFIKNIHFLGIETQDYLAEYIRFGHYRTFKTDQKFIANIRIICSSHQDLAVLTQENKFSKDLFTELKKTSLIMPSLLTVDNDEIDLLTDGFTEQAIKNKAYKDFIELNSKERGKIVTRRPVSLQELRNKVQQLLIAKSKKKDVYKEIQFDPAYNVSDPDLFEAVRLGKQALKDPRILSLLWHKFDGNQTKIAQFLKVNRSTINRRVKDLNLE